MSDTKLGILLDDAAQRDAIHVAIAPVVAAELLSPGQHIGIDSEGKASCHATKIGIVDPFLVADVEAGQRFYLCLYQNTVTGMRHQWVHPAFEAAVQPVASDKEASWEWMRGYAAQHWSSDDHIYGGFGGKYTAEMLIEYATAYLDYGDRHVQQGSESLRNSMYDDTVNAEFWKHFTVITGFSPGVSGSPKVPFCCTC